LQVKVHHRYQQQQWQIATGVNDTGSNLPYGTTGVIDTSGK
jgi:hypothetical protein